MITDVGLTLGALLGKTVATAPDRPVLHWDGSSLSYRDFEALTLKAARAWVDAGVRHGDRVVFILDNCPEFLYAFVGLSRLGASMVSLNTQLGSAELGYMIRDCGARLILTGERLLGLTTDAAAAAGTEPEVITVGEIRGYPSFSAGVANAVPAPLDLAAPSDPVSVIYTSGSTGRPKGVVHTHQSLMFFGQGYASWLGMRQEDRVYVCLPLYHVNAQAYSFLGVLAAQATLVLAEKYSRTRFWQDVSASGVTVTNLISLMLAVVTDLGDVELHKAGSLRIVYGSAVGRLSLDERARLERRLGIRMRTGYGMSETGYGFVEPLEGPLRENSVGQPRHHPNPQVARSEARILDAGGEVVPPGAEGELVLRNPAMMAGYLSDGSVSDAALADGWFRTGDYFRSDEDGFYYFAGRARDMIRCRGEKVAATEVEQVLRAAPGVAEAAVIGIPSEFGDQEVYAFVVRDGQSGCTAQQLWDFAAARLAKFKTPRFIHFLDSLPMTSSQKVSKPALTSMVNSEECAFDSQSRA